MNRYRSLLLTALLCLLLPTVSCDDDSGCRSNDDCGSEQLCNLLARTCVQDLGKLKLSEGQFKGDFTCRIADRIEQTTLEGASTVVGQLEGERLRLDGSTSCFIRLAPDKTRLLELAVFSHSKAPDGGLQSNQLAFELNLLDLDLELTSTLEPDPDVFAGGRAMPEKARVVLSRAPYVGGHTQDPITYVARAIAGNLELSNADDSGVLHAHVDMTLRGFGGNTLGMACESDDDCDASFAESCVAGFCLSACEADADCAPGGACTKVAGRTKGLCHLPCKADADCSPGQRCYDLGEGSPVCALDGLYVLPDDRNHLGASCASSDDCGFEDCYTIATGSLCAASCTDEWDCAFYVGVDKACTPLNETDSLCLPTCKASCQDGLTCVELPSGSVCLPPLPEVEQIGFEDYYAQWPRFICDWLESCNGASWSDWFYGGDCQTYLEGVFHDGETDFRADIQRGLVSYDAAAATSCVAAWQRGDCSALEAGLNYPCQDFIGNQVKGQPCGSDGECGLATAFCQLGAECPGRCQPKGKLSQACSNALPCSDGLVCEASKCVKPGGVGAACGLADPACRFGLVCAGKPATCRKPQALFSAKLNQPCDSFVGPWCQAGLACVMPTTGSNAGACRTKVAVGAACGYAYLSQCPADQYCTAATPGQTGACKALPIAGEPCVAAAGSPSCAPGTTCLNEVCRAVVGVGEPCVQAGECRSGFCVDSECSAHNRCVE